jgi:hypothetical protein
VLKPGEGYVKIAQILHAGNDTDSIAVDSLPLLDHIPKVDADTKLHRAVFEATRPFWP